MMNNRIIARCLIVIGWFRLIGERFIFARRFILKLSIACCLALFAPKSRSQLWPFTGVLRAIWPGVTRKMWRPL
jgi:hypothetical protein